MEKRIALLIIYNHRYDKNIPKLEEIHKNNFSHRFHVIPFYNGNDEIEGEIIPVVGHSWYFQGYICQAYQYIKLKFGEMYFTHYFIVADDMLLNPKLNEINILDKIGISNKDDFFPELIELQTANFPWRYHQALRYKRAIPGVEIVKELPSIEKAQKRFDKYNIRYDKIPLKVLFNRKFSFKKHLLNILRLGYLEFLFKSRKLDYPLVGGYSDIFIVTKDTMPQFVHYCAAFASSGLFVEMAIPTSMVLVSDNLKFFHSAGIKMRNGALWDNNKFSISDKFDYKLNRLIENFPEDVLFYHPIKLSKWK